jgi:hypothetical protein
MEQQAPLVMVVLEQPHQLLVHQHIMLAAAVALEEMRLLVQLVALAVLVVVVLVLVTVL